LAKACHLVGVGVWLGTLGVALIVNAGSGQVSIALRASSRTAVLGALLTVGSGLALAARTVVSITGLFATAFGELLVAKLVALVVAVSLGVLHRRRWVVLAAAESAVLALVVLAGASMATAGPAIGDAYLAAPSSVTSGAVNGQTSEVIVRLRAVPAQPGPNDLELSVVATRRPSPAPVTGVTLEVATNAGTRSWTVVPDERGNAVVPGVSLADGATDVEVSVARSGLPVEELDLTLTTRAVRFHHSPIVSSAPIRTPLLMLALAVFVVTGLVIVTWPRPAIETSRSERRASRVS
jgi:hypothetical protein